MRPSDENQHPSKRPNLFSSSHRAGGANDSILARLEQGESASPASAAMRRVPGRLVAGAVVLVLGLGGTLAMMGRADDTPARRMHVSAPQAAPSLQRPALVAAEAPILEAAPPPALVTTVEHGIDLEQILAAPALPARPDPVAGAAGKPSPAPPMRSKALLTTSKGTPRSAPVLGPRRDDSAEVDPDVAILTVILSHSRRHGAKPGGERACSGRKPCQAQF